MFPKLDGYSGRILIFIIVAVESGIFSSWGKKEREGEGEEFPRAPTGRVNSNTKRDSGLTMAHYKHGDAFRRILFNRSSKETYFSPRFSRPEFSSSSESLGNSDGPRGERTPSYNFFSREKKSCLSFRMNVSLSSWTRKEIKRMVQLRCDGRELNGGLSGP